MFAPLMWFERRLRRFARARRGTTAIEFGLIAVPFFMLTFGLAEVAMIGFAQTSLDFSATETARQIRTGQAQMNGVTEGEIEARLCQEMSNFMLVTCAGNLYIDVQRFDSFVDAGAVANPVQGGNFDPSGCGYNPGMPSDIVVVRAFYRWQVITPMFEAIFANVGGGQRVLVSSMMFRNEPYQ